MIVVVEVFGVAFTHSIALLALKKKKIKDFSFWVCLCLEN